ncbi:hypothetical protein J6590_033754 [Homalodisca vitripennis]|nr:hypothetical protein J6590_033754 [Homalodisca vitripennis]
MRKARGRGRWCATPTCAVYGARCAELHRTPHTTHHTLYAVAKDMLLVPINGHGEE